MRFITRWFRRRRDLALLAPRRRELEAELSRALGGAVSLQPAATKGGYDEVFYARQQGRSVAVVRINSPYKENHDPVGPLDAGVPLGPRDRIDREWRAYSRLAPAGLAPRPIWRGEDAMACAWMPWDRAAELLKKPRDRFWPLIERIIPAIAAMHRQEVTHLDLNLGNILSAPGGDGVAFIDFEFGPRQGVTWPQQCAYDHLRLIDNCCKRRRGGAEMLADIDRLIRLLEEHVDAAARDADIAFSLAKLNLLAGQPSLLTGLRTLFRKL